MITFFKFSILSLIEITFSMPLILIFSLLSRFKRKKFDILANSEEYQWRYILKPGDLLIFNNWRILHGRGSFNGTRKMKGCYINKEDFDSCCKMNGLY